LDVLREANFEFEAILYHCGEAVSGLRRVLHSASPTKAVMCLSKECRTTVPVFHLLIKQVKMFVFFYIPARINHRESDLLATSVSQRSVGPGYMDQEDFLHQARLSDDFLHQAHLHTPTWFHDMFHDVFVY
jgi:hypothetical protein